MSVYCLTLNDYVMARTSYIRRDYDEDVCFILEQHTQLDFYSAISVKQQSVVKHVAPSGHIVLIPSQSVLALFP